MQINQVKSERIAIKVEPKMKEKLEELARKNRCTQTSLIRTMIQHCINEMEGKRSEVKVN